MIHGNSVCGRLGNSMRFQNISVVLILGVVGTARVFGSMCFLTTTAWPEVYWYRCTRSSDYSIDAKKAPVDIARLTFTTSKIPVIRNGSFARFANTLITLVVSNSGVEEIEDNAFEGLSKLEVLILEGNKLQVIKAAWPKGLSSLCVVSFKNNQVKHIEDGFFTILPPYMDLLDLSKNQLTCLPPAALIGNFRVHSLHVKKNPLTWTCMTLLMNWFENTKFESDYHDRPPYLDTLGQPYDLAEICAAKLPSKLRPDEEFLNKCAEETSREYFPTKKNYTVKQMCAFLKGKPSPVFNCTE